MLRRLRDAILLNASFAVGHHVLVALVRLLSVAHARAHARPR